MNQKEILNDKVKPYNDYENKTTQLVRMFNGFSSEYDRFNDLVSMGSAHHWRKKAVSYLKKYEPKAILDIATGTADMCVVLSNVLNPDTIVGIDISDQMLEVGRTKLEKYNLSAKVELIVEDCADLTFEDQSFDAVTIAFGIRNLEKLSQCLMEIHRVLKPGGHFLIIEVNEPHKEFFTRLYKLYIKLIFMIATKFLAKDKNAYKYLANSMGVFPQGKKLIKILDEYNFSLKKFRRFTFGVCNAYLLRKEDNQTSMD